MMEISYLLVFATVLSGSCTSVDASGSCLQARNCLQNSETAMELYGRAAQSLNAFTMTDAELDSFCNEFPQVSPCLQNVPRCKGTRHRELGFFTSDVLQACSSRIEDLRRYKNCLGRLILRLQTSPQCSSQLATDDNAARELRDSNIITQREYDAESCRHLNDYLGCVTDDVTEKCGTGVARFWVGISHETHSIYVNRTLTECDLLALDELASTSTSASMAPFPGTTPTNTAAATKTGFLMLCCVVTVGRYLF